MRMISYLLALLLVPSFASEAGKREYQAGGGEAAVTVLSEATATDTGHGAPGRLNADRPISAIQDFASLKEASPGGEAMLEVYLHDYQDGKKLTFPLKYSELRRFLRQHPTDYQQADSGERNVALIRDLAARMDIRMKKSKADKGRKGR